MVSAVAVDVERKPILEVKKDVFLDGIFYDDNDGVSRAFGGRSDLKEMIDNANVETGEFSEGNIREVVYASSSGRRATIVSIPWKTYQEMGKPNKLEGITRYFVSGR